jgi:hypothetical protein
MAYNAWWLTSAELFNALFSQFSQISVGLALNRLDIFTLR